jgi:hypothetical protein
MNRGLRFAALVAVLGLTSWLTVAERPAYAYNTCDFWQGKPCTVSWQYCSPSGICFCMEDGHWDCSF